MIKTLYGITSILVLFSGCVNERGISARYYNDCREYYDLQGSYHKKCDENVIDYKDVGEALKTKEPEPEKVVW